ncbi:MAG: hypothetical protein VX642_15400 [Bdellovibrionota bacterium]|nr:hypothetical protein [Bdellovibrionota bacterium]
MLKSLLLLSLFFVACAKETYNYPKTSPYDARMARLSSERTKCEEQKLPIKYFEDENGMKGIADQDDFSKLEKYLIGIEKKTSSFYELRDQVIVRMEVSPLKLKHYISFMLDSCGLMPHYKALDLYLASMSEMKIELNELRKNIVKKVLREMMYSTSDELGSMLATAIVLNPNFKKFFKPSKDSLASLKAQRANTKVYLAKSDKFINKFVHKLKLVDSESFTGDLKWELNNYDKVPQDILYQFNGLIIEKYQRQKSFVEKLDNVIKTL